MNSDHTALPLEVALEIEKIEKRECLICRQPVLDGDVIRIFGAKSSFATASAVAKRLAGASLSPLLVR